LQSVEPDGGDEVRRTELCLNPINSIL
jgi:hypothetical protein